MAGLALARRLGDELLVDVGARGPAHIDPIETAKHLGIEVTFGHLNGATARIFRKGAVTVQPSEKLDHLDRL